MQLDSILERKSFLFFSFLTKKWATKGLLSLGLVGSVVGVHLNTYRLSRLDLSVFELTESSIARMNA